MTPFDIDPQVQKFIDDMTRASSGLSIDSSIEQQRENCDAGCRHFFSPYPVGIESTDSVITGRLGDIPVRHYQNHQLACDSDSQIVFIHGGGFVFGGLDSHDDICADLCANTGMTAVSIDYRLAPEHRHPVHVDDVADAFLACWKPNSILVGMSAGATLAAALSHRLKSEERQAAGQVLIYPALGGQLFNLESYRSNAKAPLLSTDDMKFYGDMRGNPALAEPISDPEFYPLVAKDFNGLPATISFSADIDPLRDDAALYSQKLTEAGIYARHHNELGLVHDYLRARHLSDKANDSFQRISEAVVLLANR